jgi:hypothetical protein
MLEEEKDTAIATGAKVGDGTLVNSPESNQ